MTDNQALIVAEEIQEWIKEWFNENGKGCPAVVGISGGKDSSIVATLCANALGADNVIGVEMPNVTQDDINYADDLIDYLGIKKVVVNIGNMIEAIEKSIPYGLTDQAKTNLPARVRMVTLYAISQSINGRVANTCNLSEDYVGYATIWGDSCGDFSPLHDLTVSQVKAVGYALNLPKKFIEKTPSDGLCGKSDEDNLGYTYAQLDQYIDGNRSTLNSALCDKILRDHTRNEFKIEAIQLPHYKMIHDWR